MHYKPAGEGKVTYEVGEIAFLMKSPTSAR